MPLAKFPFIIIYEIIESEVVIYSVFHTSRNPDKSLNYSQLVTSKRFLNKKTSVILLHKFLKTQKNIYHEFI